MQIKNFEDINIGDIGYVKDINTVYNSTSVQVDFGEGKIKWYESDDLNMLDLGYASTIHKSQGSEYTSNNQFAMCSFHNAYEAAYLYDHYKRKGASYHCRRTACALHCHQQKRHGKRGTCLAVRIKNKLK